MIGLTADNTVRSDSIRVGGRVSQIDCFTSNPSNVMRNFCILRTHLDGENLKYISDVLLLVKKNLNVHHMY